MAHRVKLTTLDASSLKIINTIRENASYEYQQNVPVITDAKMIPKVGEIIVGNGSLQNQFLNALMNRIAKVVIESATFNNPYAHLKKGYLETGETIEDIFIGIANVVEYDAEKGDDASKYRGISNKITFMSKKYNQAEVRTTTPKSRQAIFMDAEYNAKFDVNVLASAFHMEKADFMGRLHLIDDWTTFDNERFDIIRANCDSIEKVTPEELKAMENVKAVLVDENYFQVYDNLSRMTEQYCASGMYWNYFYNTWKTVAVSPFSNMVTFVVDGASIAQPATVTVKVSSKDIAEEATVFTLEVQDDNVSLANGAYQFVQTQDAVTNGIAIHKYGAVIFPTGKTTTTLEMIYGGYKYTAKKALTTSDNVGVTITFDKGDAVEGGKAVADEPTAKDVKKLN